MANTGNPWTPEQTAELRQLRAQGWDNTRIAAHFGRSRNAIDKKMTRMNRLDAGIRAPKVDRSWSDAQADEAVGYWQTGESLNDIAKRIGRTRNAVKGLITRKGAHRNLPSMWTPERVETVRRLYVDERKSYTVIGLALDVHRSAIGGLIYRMGWKRGANDVWPQALIDQAQALWDAGKSAAEIGVAVGRSRVAVCGIARRRNWKPHKNTPSLRAAQSRPRKRKPSANVLKFGGVRMSPDIKPPVALPAVEPLLEHAVSLWARTSRQCCYPVGEATGADQLYCGAAKGVGDYCTWHRGVMYNSRKAA